MMEMRDAKRQSVKLGDESRNEELVVAAGPCVVVLQPSTDLIAGARWFLRWAVHWPLSALRINAHTTTTTL